MLWSGPLATGMSTQRLSKRWLIRTAAAYLGYAATGTRDVVWSKRERESGGREREREREGGGGRGRLGRVEGTHLLLKGVKPIIIADVRSCTAICIYGYVALI